MIIQVNAKPITLEKEVPLKEVLKEINILSFQGIAVAINNTIISKSVWETHLVKENDSLTIIRATQGG